MLTGQVPPDIILSKESASGMPLEIRELPEAIDSSRDFRFSPGSVSWDLRYDGRR